MNILETANDIINNRSQEKERQYGDIGEEMEKVVDIYNLLTKKTLSAKDIYLILAILKLCRESVHHKEDNLLDCVAYLGAMNDHIEKRPDLTTCASPIWIDKTKPETKACIGF